MIKIRKEAWVLATIILLTSLAMAAEKPVGDRSFKVELSGNEEVPPVKSEAVGTATFDVSEGGNVMTYNFVVSRIRDITGAFICRGKRGENGAIIVDLFKEPWKEDISGTFIGEGKIEPYLLTGPLRGGSVHSLIQLVESGDAYINIQTMKHPDGEIRGQIQ
jgi:hypothetical protein